MLPTVIHFSQHQFWLTALQPLWTNYFLCAFNRYFSLNAINHFHHTLLQHPFIGFYSLPEDDCGSEDTRLWVTSRSSRSSLSCIFACSSNSLLLFDGRMGSSFFGTGPEASFDCCIVDVRLLLWGSVVGGRAEIEGERFYWPPLNIWRCFWILEKLVVVNCGYYYYY